MRNSVQFHIDKIDDLIAKLVFWSKQYDPVCILNNNRFTAQNDVIDGKGAKPAFELLAGVGSLAELIPDLSENGFDALKKMADDRKDWLLGYLTYDLKNHNEQLNSGNFDGTGFPVIHFFVPRYMVKVSNDVLTIEYHTSVDTEEVVRELYQQILNTVVKEIPEFKSVKVRARMNREEYLQKIQGIRAHIQRGDIYEVNFCQEFYAENTDIDPGPLYLALNKMSPAPFSAFYAHEGKYLMCASPERYITKKGQLVYSQPIKGTAPRGKNEAEDVRLREALKNDLKEQSENVMIVDLVRNDLSRTATRGSVKVTELFGVYTFRQVHQLISTVRAELKEDVHFTDVIRDSFPMGSMTGAPKIRAMELIEEFEESRRGLFSGSVGYITPEGDFDFNVIIRSMVYNKISQYLSFTTGGAITIRSEAQREYEECLLKAQAMMKVLGVETFEENKE